MDELSHFSSPSSVGSPRDYSEKDSYYNLVVSQLRVLESQNDIIIERLQDIVALNTKILHALNQNK